MQQLCGRVLVSDAEAPRFNHQHINKQINNKQTQAYILGNNRGKSIFNAISS